MQRLCFELGHDRVLGLTLRKRLGVDCMFARRDLYKFLKEFLVIPLYLSLPHCLFVGTNLLLVPEEPLLVIHSELARSRITVCLLLRDFVQLLFMNFVRSDDWLDRN